MKPMMLLTKLHEAELTSHSAELVSSAMKDAVVEMPIAANLSASDVQTIARQKDMLVTEMETFRNLRRAIEQLLKTTTCSKANMEETIEYIEVLLDMVFEDEAANAKQKNTLKQKEMELQELYLLLQKEKDGTATANRLSSSLETTQAHLQSQIEKKVADNEQTSDEIESLKAQISEKKLETKELKHKLETKKKQSVHDKEALKKAIKMLKRRMQHCEAAKENVTSQIRVKDAELHEVLSASSVWKSHHEKAVEERTGLEIQLETLTQKLTDTITSMQKIREHNIKSKEELLENLDILSSENERLNQENADLKASIGSMEEDINSIECECADLQEKVNQEKSFVEQYEAQVHKIQNETEKLKSRFEKVLMEKKQISENKDLETEKVMGQMDARLQELEHIPALLKAAEHSLRKSQESLLMSKESYTGQSNIVTQLWKQMESNSFFAENHSIEMDNRRVQKKLVDLNLKMEAMITENQKLKESLAVHEQSLRSSACQLAEKSKERSTFLRLLETAVEDGRKQVSAERENTASREQVIEKRITDLENELKKKKAEKKHIASTLSITEKHYELRLKELKQSLEQTESKNQNIQNYLQLLKTSYATMFG